MSLIHPGRLYLKTKPYDNSCEYINGYVEFLKEESNSQNSIPVDLNGIYRHFGIPLPKLAPLPNQALLVNPEQGIIIINENDSFFRRRFSEAHELIEYLFDALPKGQDIGRGWKIKQPGGFRESFKEYLCNRAAANLLLPPNEILTRVVSNGLTMATARIIANEFQVSLSAAIIQMVITSKQPYSIVLWKNKNKETEIKQHVPDQQITLPGIEANRIAPTKLRVEWSYRSSSAPFIPRGKSVEKGTNIYKAWETKVFTEGDDLLLFSNRRRFPCFTQNLPFDSGNETQVISLVRFDINNFRKIE